MIFVLSFANAHAKNPDSNYKLSHRLNQSSSSTLATPAVGTYHILAVMVDFQEDDDSKTTGNGQFDGLDFLPQHGENIIDPLPHNCSYFERKLQFVQHYFKTVSDGNLMIEYTVPDTVYRLSQSMSNYAPPKDSDDMTNLAEMVKEVWQMVDTSSADIDFSKYQAFVIFHAGIGRDVDMVASTGVDPTPYDIPSITFNLATLQNVYGEDFDGISVENGTVKITNTAVLPQTESREIEAIGGDVLLELSINGLAAASFASILGLPDLFNTEDGSSGIGRFGLADGEGIFNYSGILPPEPSAWERIFLGWANPILVQSLDEVISLPAQGLHQNPDSVIYKVPISSTEYFLIENRHRNAKGNGVTITRYFNGQELTDTFTKDEDDFEFYSAAALDGDVIASSNYDWTIPAGLVEDDNGNQIQVDGGILIWHIDESVIDNQLAENKVNAGEVHGVRLLEADGSNDIGEDYSLTDAGYGTQSGSPLDYFFEGNLSPIYKNEIDAETYPNTNANNGAETGIQFTAFSEQGTIMTVQVLRSQNLLKAIEGFPVELSGKFSEQSGISILQNPSGSELALLLNDANDSARVYFLSDAFSIATFLTDEPQIASRKPAISENGSIATVHGKSIYLMAKTGSTYTIDSLTTSDAISTPPVLNSDGTSLKVGTVAGKTYEFKIEDGQFTADSTVQHFSSGKILGFADDMIVTEQKAILNSISWDFGNNTAVSFAGTGNSEGWLAAVLTQEKKLFLLFADGTSRTVSVPCNNALQAWPAIADLEHRKALCVLFPASDKLYAYNEQGFLVTNFPIETHADSAIASSPIVLDIDGDTYEEILIQTPDGKLLGYNRDGDKILEYALSAGSSATPSVYFDENAQALYLFAVDHGGFLNAFTLPKGTANIQWSGLYANSTNQNVYTPQTTSDREQVSITSLMPEKSVYNWPNPAKDETRFRFYLTQACDVDIKVYDLTGNEVWKKSVRGVANIDNEVVWSLGNVASGIYFGIVKAKNSDAEHLVKLKVAVVK
ncbi:T9SS type A sorting domain-containing protein [Chloroherpeton thalassium]|uniref:T9SS-dependent M6-like inactivated metalloprotease n=1 Tax=Chloroherpeton thalassium TaxID=100716 RepID=UPI000326C49E|nr:T9SS type A sorting domain-containing protein [Chloroherpeton thalassium]